jgi:hypothetical protein
MESQRERIRAALLRGERITRIEALSNYGVARLAARVGELDKEMNILRGWRKIRTAFDNKNTRIREYWLEAA